MKTSEMAIGSVVYTEKTNPMVVLGFADFDSSTSRYRTRTTKRVMGAVIHVSDTGEVSYNAVHLRPQDVLRDFAPDCTTAVAQMVADRAKSSAYRSKEVADLADRKARFATVLTQLSALGLNYKQDDYRVGSGSHDIKVSLADIEALLAKVA